MNAGEIVTLIMTVIGIVIYALNHLIESNQQKKVVEQRRDAQRQQPEYRQQTPAGRPATSDDDVDSFLRDVARRRQNRDGSPAQQQQPIARTNNNDDEIEALRRRRALQQQQEQQRRQEQQRKLEQQQRKQEERRAPRPKPSRPAPPPEPRTPTLAERSKMFSDRVATETSRHDLDSKLAEYALDHQGASVAPQSPPQISSGDAPQTVRRSESDFSLEIGGLVSDPVALRRAFILQSILERPDDPFTRRII
jgi:gamma-glutamyl:cysteine ligase YbdK (ATP-grasp superfamily)